MVRNGKLNKKQLRVRRVVDVPLHEVSGICLRRSLFLAEDDFVVRGGLLRGQVRQLSLARRGRGATRQREQTAAPSTGTAFAALLRFGVYFAFDIVKFSLILLGSIIAIVEHK